MILCVGPPKAGTSTLHRAFTEAGLRSCHGTSDKEVAHPAVGMWAAWQQGRDPLAFVPRDLDAITDPYVTGSKKWGGEAYWPTFDVAFLHAFRYYNPDAKIVLHTREPRAWLDSVKRWKDLRDRIANADLPHLPKGVGYEDIDMVSWIHEHYQRVRKLFQDDLDFIEAAIEAPDTPRRLESFLGIDLPWWGKENANPK